MNSYCNENEYTGSHFSDSLWELCIQYAGASFVLSVFEGALAYLYLLQRDLIEKASQHDKSGLLGATLKWIAANQKLAAILVVAFASIQVPFSMTQKAYLPVEETL